MKLSSSERAKDKRLQTIYNTTLEKQNAQRDEQKNACAICRRSFAQFTAFQDHDHKCCPRRLKNFCGKCNRGLICYLCNKYAVGLVEWMRKMDISFDKVIEYIKFWDAEIARKGGYAPKEKGKSKKRKSRGKQKSFRRSNGAHTTPGSTVVESLSRCQPRASRQWGFTESRKAYAR
jgi:hypothetical protein